MEDWEYCCVCDEKLSDNEDSKCCSSCSRGICEYCFKQLYENGHDEHPFYYKYVFDNGYLCVYCYEDI